MDDYEKSEDALFERLTLTREFRTPAYPPYYCRGEIWDLWYGYPVRHPKSKDVVYLNSEGKFHRIYGPAIVSKDRNYTGWFKNGVYHREGGPAIICNKNKIWMVDGKFHRLDGPAIDMVAHPKEYWIGGQKLSPKEYKKEIERRKRKGLIK